MASARNSVSSRQNISIGAWPGLYPGWRKASASVILDSQISPTSPPSGYANCTTTICCTCYSDSQHEASEHRDPTIEIGSDILSGWAGRFLLGYERLSADEGRGNRERHGSAQS